MLIGWVIRLFLGIVFLSFKGSLIEETTAA
jgi:hypothetical protein